MLVDKSIVQIPMNCDDITLTPMDFPLNIDYPANGVYEFKAVPWNIDGFYIKAKYYVKDKYGIYSVLPSFRIGENSVARLDIISTDFRDYIYGKKIEADTIFQFIAEMNEDIKYATITLKSRINNHYSITINDVEITTYYNESNGIGFYIGTDDFICIDVPQIHYGGTVDPLFILSNNSKLSKASFKIYEIDYDCIE